MRVTRYRGLGILGGHYVVKINDYASAPIVEELGLRVSADGTLEPRLAYWVSFDCSYGEGENLFVVEDAEAGDRPGTPKLALAATPPPATTPRGNVAGK